ncbi:MULTISPECIES: ABC transporter ATP-binding protein [unclassified Streptomyces]|uniref:ABC transporter ATP-binding protein n=1 Tax=unclassified Streptomyces TaxID=2593676 RepID=UPI000369F943|nr:MULTISPECIES: ATP-binding cassette domain-containing protein [unclassified Streptomyces]MYQ78935.1 ATP-binding cassette domain-containing protein [Streptomyces sp. SID4923]
MTPVRTAAREPVAVIQGLRVEVGGRAVLDGVDLRLRPGRITALTGGSGSGKTTTGLALLGEYPPGARVTGSVRVPQGLIGYVPQHPAAVLNPARRIGALLMDIARDRVRHLPRPGRRAAARERVLDALARVRLPADGRLLRRFPHQLSGGQQQRVVLAQVLLLGARAVVADEPTTSQDPLTKRGIVDLLADVARQGIAVLLLSHDMDVVRALADEVVVLHDGRVRDAAPADVPARAPLGGAEREGVVLDARSLVARHGRTPVLDRVSLTVRAGECLAVVGRSGSGKTTLARCLSGLHPRHGGDVLLDGRPLPAGLRERSRRQVAGVQYVFQDAKAAFDAYRPVLDQVARTAVRLRGADPAGARREALALLGALGLPEAKAARLPAHLSGGELQRAALARAVLARPRVLVCDEITSGLDPLTRDAVLGLLGGLLRSGHTDALVLITHDLATAARADRIAVMDDGRVVETGAAERVLGAPEHACTRELVAADRSFAAAG